MEKRPVVAPRRLYPRVFAEWGIHVTLALGEDGQVYFPVRHLCEGLGIHVGAQLKKLSESPEYRGELVDIPMETPGGIQRVACLRKRQTAWWLINLDDTRCNAPIRGYLQEIKARLMAAADAILFGDIAVAPHEHRGLLTSASHTEIVMACLTCGTTHRITTINGEVSVVLEREQS